MKSANTFTTVINVLTISKAIKGEFIYICANIIFPYFPLDALLTC